ncbi:MAG: hypothetical protein WCC26_00295 [Terracidiphilus sp.]
MTRMRSISNCLLAALLLFCALPLRATTLVVRLENGRILLAADTRQERLNPIQQTMRQSGAGDARCKVRAFGSMGFAMTGIVEYDGHGLTATLPDWNAYDDAAAAWKSAGANLHDLAADWAKRSATHFTRLYEADPERVKQLAGTNPDRLLQVAFFAGWDKAAPVFVVEILSYEPDSSPVIQVKAFDRPINDAPFSTNAVTQELIDGTTDRAQQATAEWDDLSENIAGNELAWKHVAFYIQKTAVYDPTVSPVVDVLSIPAGKPPEWLERGACS